MARYTGADCRRCRREKMKLFLKGRQCDGPKCPFESPPVPARPARPWPDQGDRVPAPASREAEGPPHLRRAGEAVPPYYEEANRPSGKTGEELLQILESRLDNVVYRAGFAQSRDMARQLVKHGHFLVNGKKVDIPSYRVSQHDIVQVREKSVEMTPFVVAREAQAAATVPAWLEAIPEPDEDPDPLAPGPAAIDTQVQEQLIVELYSSSVRCGGPPCRWSAGSRRVAVRIAGVK